jgi:hypothetical protein
MAGADMIDQSRSYLSLNISFDVSPKRRVEILRGMCNAEVYNEVIML